MDFVWNKNAAENIREACNETLNKQIDNMRNTASSYSALARGLDTMADMEANIANTAMRTIIHIDSEGNKGPKQIADDEARITAGRREADYRNQAHDLRGAVVDIDRAIGRLEAALEGTDMMFERLHTTSTQIDKGHSSQIQTIELNIADFTNKMKIIRDSFNSDFPVMSLMNSLQGLDGVPYHDMVNGFLAAALRGYPVFTAFAGDPVNMVTGNFVYSKEDIAIPGRFSLAFERFYNTIGDDKVSDMGYNWTHNLDIRLTVQEKSIVITFGDGHVETYHDLGEEKYIPVLSNGKALIKTDKGWALRSPNMETYLFDHAGMLQCITDINNTNKVFSYEDGLLSKVSTPNGHLSFTYDDANHLISVSDHTRRKVMFKYTDDRLTKVVYPAGEAYDYIYDSLGRLIELFTPFGTRETKSEFDSNNRATKQYLADDGVIEYIYSDDKKESTYVQQNGSKVIYKRDDKYRTNQIVYPDGSKRFEYDTENRKTLAVDKCGNQTRYSYNNAGKVSDIVNPLGVKTKIKYSPQNQISSVVVDEQKKFQNHYDDEGKLVIIEDALHNKTKFNYLQKGIPKTITQPDGSQIHLTYDERMNITQIIDSSGVITSYRYNDLNRVIGTVDGNDHETNYRYDTAGRLIEVRNALGDVRSYDYDVASNVTKIVDFDGSCIRREYNVLNKPSKLIDQLGRETLLNYDKMWNLAHVVEPNKAETRFVYNELNQLEAIEKPDGSILSYQYNANGNRTGIIDELGNQTHLKYDALGRLIEVTGPEGLAYRYAYNVDGQLTTGSDAMGNTVSLTYDKAGQLIEEVNALGDSRKYTYTPLGKVASVTDEAGRITSYEYQPGGRLEAVLYPDNTKETYSYDKGGNLKTVVGRGDLTITYDYDCLNRVIRITNSVGTSKSYTYDSVGNVTAMTDGNGNVTIYSYTATGKLKKVVDPLGSEALYFYDEGDRLIAVCQNAGENLGLDEELQEVITGNPGNSQLSVTIYERNIMGQVVAITDSLGHRENYSYDLRGQLIERLDKDGYLTQYSYTAHGDVSHIQYADGREVKLSYNPLRQLTEIEDWLGLTKIELDPLGRTTKVINHQDKEVSYTWAATGLRTAVTYPDGKDVSYEYDNCLRLTKVVDDTDNIHYKYDEHSRLTEKLFSDGLKTAYQYNELGYLQELQHISPDGILDQFKYLYDNLGNKTKIIKERRDMPEESGTYTYTYDPLNRLQEVFKDGQALRGYEYDGYGNRLAMTDGDTRTSYIYNSMNQLISTVDTLGNELKYVYDKRGNMTEKHKNNTLTNQYIFGALNRLEQAVNHETGMSATYRYNGLGYRVGQSISGDNSVLDPTKQIDRDNFDLSPTKHIDDVLDLTRKFNNLLERREDDTVTAYTWDSSLLSVASARGTSKSYLLDEMGSPARLVGEDGLTETYAFDEFGNASFGTPSSDEFSNTSFGVPNYTQPFGFTGYQQDPIAGTWFAQSREYDPQTGRYMGKDLNRHIHSNIVQSLNLYQYCHNNPIRYIDPMGFDLEEVMNDLFPDSNLSQNAGSNDAVQIGINGNVVTIDVYVHIQGDTNVEIGGRCVVDLTIEGIQEWSGVHLGSFGEVVAVDINVHQVNARTRIFGRQNYIPVNIIDGPGVSNLMRPSSGWSPRTPGTINLHTHFRNHYDDDGNLIRLGDARTSWQFVNVSTHEFGHGFGVNDANAEWREDKPPRPAADMMIHFDYEIMARGMHHIEGYISRHSIQMMIYAIMSGDWQQFMEYERGTQSITLDASLPKNRAIGGEPR